MPIYKNYDDTVTGHSINFFPQTKHHCFDVRSTMSLPVNILVDALAHSVHVFVTLAIRMKVYGQMSQNIWF